MLTLIAIVRKFQKLTERDVSSDQPSPALFYHERFLAEVVVANDDFVATILVQVEEPNDLATLLQRYNVNGKVDLSFAISVSAAAASWIVALGLGHFVFRIWVDGLKERRRKQVNIRSLTEKVFLSFSNDPSAQLGSSLFDRRLNRKKSRPRTVQIR